MSNANNVSVVGATVVFNAETRELISESTGNGIYEVVSVRRLNGCDELTITALTIPARAEPPFTVLSSDMEAA